MVLLTPAEFLDQLSNLFISARTKGNIIVTQKSYNGVDKPKPQTKKVTKSFFSKASTGDSNEPVFNKILIRAKTPKQKLSTVVTQPELLEFQVAYCKLLRSSMDGLKKRDRKRKTGKKVEKKEPKKKIVVKS